MPRQEERRIITQCQVRDILQEENKEKLGDRRSIRSMTIKVSFEQELKIKLTLHFL